MFRVNWTLHVIEKGKFLLCVKWQFPFQKCQIQSRWLLVTVLSHCNWEENQIFQKEVIRSSWSFNIFFFLAVYTSQVLSELFLISLSIQYNWKFCHFLHLIKIYVNLSSGSYEGGKLLKSIVPVKSSLPYQIHSLL